MSFLYNPYLEACLSGDVTHLSHVQPLVDDLVALAVSVGYVPSSAHQFISAIGGGNIIKRSAHLASKDIAGGTLRFANQLLTSVTGAQIVAIIIARDRADDTISPLMAYLNDGDGLPDLPNGSDITLFVDPGVHAAFTL